MLFCHCRPYHPQICGKVERLRQTLKKWLARQPRAATLAYLQDPLDAFRAYYNHLRPHRVLERRTRGANRNTAEAYAARPRATASGVPLIDGRSRSEILTTLSWCEDA